MELQQAQEGLVAQIRPLYDEREASLIADWVMEQITGLKKIDRILQKKTHLQPEKLELLKQYTGELRTGRPVQYVLHESWFMGMKLYVDEHVLIPRPETEELVQWAIGEMALHPAPESAILDVGTGSGCIAIALQRQLPGTTVHACDISENALAIAKRNADANGAVINFQKVNFLDRTQWETLPPVHTIVSNPPYIPLGEKDSMARHVVDFEPHLALFVENEDPLIFYRALATFALKKQSLQGQLLVEIHEDLAQAVANLFHETGLTTIEVKKDMQGKDRIIKATW